MAFCLPQKDAKSFLDAIRTKKLDLEDLPKMSSAARRETFAKIVGDEMAPEVNALFESKLILKDWKKGMVSFVKKTAGLSDKGKLDFLAKVERLDRVLEPAEESAFLADLAAQKLGATVTPDEARAISQGAKELSTLRDQWDGTAWSSNDARLEYGAAFTKYQDYVGALVRDANVLGFKEWIKSPGKVALDIASSTKGIVASLDNSFFGRQGIKMFWTNPDIWAKAFAKSWGDFGKTIAGGDPTLAVKADVFSRPNAMNNKYKNMKVAIGIDFEEAFPTSIPERIPVFGRFYKASENAFTLAAMRMRADYADRLIAKAEAFGVDMARKGKQAEGIGALVNAMTGRGNITMSKKSADVVNATFFSLRFLKSNFDTLTAQRLGFAVEKGPARDFVRRQAAGNLLKIVGGMAAVLFTAEQLWPESVEWDPRSSNFGKIKIGNTRFDITGGMGSMVTLAARLTPVFKDGKVQFWSKSAVSGRWTNLAAGKYGQQTGLDVLESFWEGKLSPSLGIVRDVLKGSTFDGEPVTVSSALRTLTVPISYQSFTEAMNDPNAAPLLAVFILDGLGIGSSTYGRKNKSENPREIWDLELSP